MSHAAPTELYVTGDLGFGPTATLEIELAGTSPGHQYDRILVDGVATLNGSLDVLLIDGFATQISGTDQFTVLESTSLLGEFSNARPGARLAIDGLDAWIRVDYGQTSPFDPNHLVLSDFAPLPPLTETTWNGTNGFWQTDAAWSGNVSPNNTDNARYHAVINGGNVTSEVPVSVSALTLNNFNGTLTLSETMTVGELQWLAGNLGGSSALTLTGESTFATLQNVNTGPGLVNQGTATWVVGDLTGTFGAQGFVNQGVFLIELVDDQNFQYFTNSASGVIRHTGTARAWLGGNTAFENDGLVEITGGGTLRVGRDLANGSDGDFVIADGRLETTVGFSVDHKFNGSVTGEEFRSLIGNVSMNGAYDVETTTVEPSKVTFNTPTPAKTDHLTLNGNLSVETELQVDQLNWTGGGFEAGAGQTVLSGDGVISSPAQKSLFGRLLNQGALTWEDGSFADNQSGLIRNEGVFSIELGAEHSMRYFYNTPTGVVRHVSGARANVGPNGGFENDGFVEITGGGTLVIGRDRGN
ncbi:MAG: hypothetical protein AAF961_08470, partial [Planctomycetota bacterium]